MAKDRYVTTLYRYFIWADQMRLGMEETLRQHGIPNTVVSFEGDRLFLYTSYYHSALYIVIEGWQDLRLVDPRIDELLASDNVALLRRYRNGTFHFQREYLDDRVVGFMQPPRTSVWVRNLRDAFAQWFDRFFEEAADRYPPQKEQT